MADATNVFGIPPRYYDEILEGVESDLVKDRFANFDELRDYCYKVASVVGLICIEVFGYEDPKAEGYAVDMGIALQLTNILRDLDEDAGRDRIYLPQDELAEFGYSEEDLKSRVINDQFRSLMTYQVERARSYYERSRPLFDMVDLESRTCLRVLHEAYLAILDRIEQSGFDVYSQRIGSERRSEAADYSTTLARQRRAWHSASQASAVADDARPDSRSLRRDPTCATSLKDGCLV